MSAGLATMIAAGRPVPPMIRSLVGSQGDERPKGLIFYMGNWARVRPGRLASTVRTPEHRLHHLASAC